MTDDISGNHENELVQFCYNAFLGDGNFEEIQKRLAWNFSASKVVPQPVRQEPRSNKTELVPNRDPIGEECSNLVNLPSSCFERIFVVPARGTQASAAPARPQTRFTRYFFGGNGTSPLRRTRKWLSNLSEEARRLLGWRQKKRSGDPNDLDEDQDEDCWREAIDFALAQLNLMTHSEGQKSPASTPLTVHEETKKKSTSRESVCPDSNNQTSAFKSQSDHEMGDHEHYPWPWIDVPNPSELIWELGIWLDRNLLSLETAKSLLESVAQSDPGLADHDTVDICLPTNDGPPQNSRNCTGLTLEVWPIPVLPSAPSRQSSSPRRDGGVDHLNLIQVVGRASHEDQPTLSKMLLDLPVMTPLQQLLPHILKPLSYPRNSDDGRFIT